MSIEQGEQYWLFDNGLDSARLREVRADFMSCERAVNTNKTYDNAWKNFQLWCREYGRPALPTSERTLLDFITWQLDTRKHRMSTVQSALFAIRHHHLQANHPSPIATDDIKALLRNASRKLRERPRGKKALTPKQLQRICTFLEKDAGPLALRDQAMILLAFAAGWRRSEVCSLTLADISFDDKHVCVQLGASKTDQDGKEGRLVAIPEGKVSCTDLVRVLREWIKVRGPWHGPLFCRFDRSQQIQRKGITGLMLNLRLKQALEDIGENSARYGAHSLRAGMATSAAESGASLASIMQRTGHKQVSTVLKYVRPAEAFRSDPLAGVL